MKSLLARTIAVVWIFGIMAAYLILVILPKVKDRI